MNPGSVICNQLHKVSLSPSIKKQKHTHRYILKWEKRLERRKLRETLRRNSYHLAKIKFSLTTATLEKYNLRIAMKLELKYSQNAEFH